MTPMPSQHRPGYQRAWQAIRREACRRLIARHRDEYDALVHDLKQHRHSTH